MARNEQLIRQHKILQILERYRFGRTLDEIRQELVDELGLTSLHQRTVRRDLEALQAAGIDVDDLEDSSRGRIWKIGPGVSGTHKVTASATELIALSLSRDLLYPLAGTPFWLGIESFWSKLRDQLPDAVWDHYEDYRQVLFVRGMPAKSYRQQHGILQTLHRCIQEHRIAEIEYQPIGKDPTPAQDRAVCRGVLSVQPVHHCGRFGDRCRPSPIASATGNWTASCGRRPWTLVQEARRFRSGKAPGPEPGHLRRPPASRGTFASASAPGRRPGSPKTRGIRTSRSNARPTAA